jgi:predicted RNA polymerase sigma factor
MQFMLILSEDPQLVATEEQRKEAVQRVGEYAMGLRVWAVRADLHHRLGDRAAALADYARALDLVSNDVERRYLAGARQRAADPERSHPARADGTHGNAAKKG